MEGIFTIKDKNNSADFFFFIIFFQSIEVFLKEKRGAEVKWMFIF